MTGSDETMSAIEKKEEGSPRSPDAVRTSVSEAYARAVTEPGEGCCGGGCGAGETKGALAQFVRYEEGELAGLPEEAVANSFGCGNPVAFTGVREGDVVLDLGSGAGMDLLLASRKVGPGGRVIGVDMTDAMIEKARANIAAAGADNVEVRKGYIEALPVESGSVDWVISNCVINLSPEKGKVFTEIARVLKPGGQILISDLVVEDLEEWVRKDPGLYNSCVGGAISEREYLAGLERAGLSEVAVRDRLIYDAARLESFVESEITEAPAEAGQAPAESAAGCCCGTPPSGAGARSLADALSGKVRSVMVYARKPTV
jgi:SAM-dependent methyltransferase